MILIVKIITKDNVANPITLTIIPKAESFGKLSCNLSQNDFSLGELIPCKVQQLFTNNIFVKHILGYLTLLFFATLTINELNQSHFVLFITLLIYLGVIILSKTSIRRS